MCGLFGILELGGKGIDLDRAGAALDLIRHRGPDDEGWLLLNTVAGTHSHRAGKDTLTGLGLPPLLAAKGRGYNAALGFRRLAILDVGEAGHQPMASPDGQTWLLFNGEIYNHLELRAELERKGHSFRTRTDTEVILAAYREWGPEAVTRFEGMFALCLVDLVQQKVFFARDAFGIKPLYFARIPGAILFASEIRSLLAYPEVDRRLQPQKLFEYMRFGLVDGTEDTMLDGIKEFPAATWGTLAFGDPSLRLVRYWQLDPSNTFELDLETAAAFTRAQLEESVHLHLQSDVPLGTCLSGGVDSTAILMLMKASRGSSQPIEAFSFLTDDPVLSEKRFVELATRSAKVSLHCVTPTPQELAQDLEALVRCQEFPFGSSSVYAQFRVFRLAQQAGMTVMLDGQGADEMFAGYYRFVGAKATSHFSTFRILRAFRLLKDIPGNMRPNFYRMFLFSLGRLVPEALRPLFRHLVGDPLFPSWMDQGWFHDHGVIGSERPCGTGPNALKEEMVLAVHGSLQELLRYEDRNSMWHSIESRVPFCHRKLAELALSLPSDFLISSGGVTKFILKRCLRDVVPDAIINREKVGFGTPEGEWLTAMGPLVQETIDLGLDMKIPFLTNLRKEVSTSIQVGNQLTGQGWRILNLILWMKAFDVKID